MAKRVKHLLEAFQQTAPTSSAPSGGASASRPVVPVLSHPLRFRSSPLVAPKLLTHGIALCTGLLFGVLVGRYSGGVEAAGPRTPPIVEPQVSGVPALGGSVAAPASGESAAATPGSGSNSSQEGGAAIEAALRDKANQYTLLAITYGSSSANRELAQSTAAYLRTKGLPASDPVLRGKSLCLLVGAAPSKAALQALQTRLRDTTSPSGASRDFQTAYPVEIDNYIAR
ncbi:MAG: hypothetical protein FJ299_15410 [Planctomycetes bacterium]|nr:hypothetical protein [Planctomycetota bacterium]